MARKKKVKDIHIGKEDVKLSLSMDVINTYRENLMESTKKATRINEFTKVADTRSTYKNQLYFYY